MNRPGFYTKRSLRLASSIQNSLSHLSFVSTSSSVYSSVRINHTMLGATQVGMADKQQSE